LDENGRIMEMKSAEMIAAWDGFGCEYF